MLSLDAQLLETGLDPGERPPLGTRVGRIVLGGLDHEVELELRRPILLGAQMDRRIERVDAVPHLGDGLEDVKRYRPQALVDELTVVAAHARAAGRPDSGPGG